MTTSGDAFQAIEIEGIRYSHIVDPRTGIGVVGSAGVTVIAPDATTADALATTLSVLGPEAGYKFVEKTEDCSARFVWYEAGKVRVRTSSQWSSQTSYSAQKK